MSRINLVIADCDSEYVEGLVKFLISKYTGKFNVSSFTKKEHLTRFLIKDGKSADILLLSPAVYEKSITVKNINTIIFLSEKDYQKEFDGWNAIYKYQHGDRLVGSVLNIFSDNNRDRAFTTDRSSKTSLIAVYSPSGGIGKTSIAIGCSILSARENLSIFYLNLEDVPSSNLFSESLNGLSFSNVIFDIKERRPNFTLRIEGSRNVHQENGVYYFAPPDSLRELNEIHEEDMEFFINQFKTADQYDAVFIDMSSSFNQKNKVVLEKCDEIFFILENSTSLYKAKLFESEIEILIQKDKSTIPEKVKPIVNKYRGCDYLGMESISIFCKKVTAKVPFVHELGISNDMEFTLNTHGEFKSSLREILKSSQVF